MAQYKALSVAGDRGGFMQAFGNAVTGYDVVTPSAALALNDTVDLIWVPGGTTLLDLETWNGDLDTGTTLQFKLGYRKAKSTDVYSGSMVDDDDYFGATLTTFQAAVLKSAATRWAFTPLTFNTDVIITATVTAAAIGVSGTPSISAIFRGIARGIK